MADRPGILADIAHACGRADVNIDSMQVFVTGPEVIDELVIDAPDSWPDVQIAQLFADAGGEGVAVTRVDADLELDATTRYLRGVHQILEEDRSVEDVLADLLQIEPPDVVDYAGHDLLDLTRRNGTVLRISRAVPFTPVERARAQALLSLVSDSTAVAPTLMPSPRHPIPLVRSATLSDAEAIERLHERCSIETLYHRYQVPLQLPMSSRMARHSPAGRRGMDLSVADRGCLAGTRTGDDPGQARRGTRQGTRRRPVDVPHRRIERSAAEGGRWRRVHGARRASRRQHPHLGPAVIGPRSRGRLTRDRPQTTQAGPSGVEAALGRLAAFDRLDAPSRGSHIVGVSKKRYAAATWVFLDWGLCPVMDQHPRPRLLRPCLCHRESDRQVDQRRRALGVRGDTAVG